MIQSLDANGAMVLMALGALLVFAEFCLPGWVLPGVVGGVALVSGGYRLSQLEAAWAPAAAVLGVLGLTAIAGYGRLPEWIGWLTVGIVPLLAWRLLPGRVHWAAALSWAAPAAVLFGLLRIAAQALANKTLADKTIID